MVLSKASRWHREHLCRLPMLRGDASKGGKHVQRVLSKTSYTIIKRIINEKMLVGIEVIFQKILK
jgi:hypothetical protein